MNHLLTGKSNALNDERLKHRILVIDDEEPILFAIKDYFELHGHGVDCAQNAQEAETLLNQADYSIVIVDLCLTGIGDVEGLKIVSKVRRRLPSTCIILLTACGSREIEVEALRQGVNAILPKPQPLPLLEQVIWNALVSLEQHLSLLRQEGEP